MTLRWRLTLLYTGATAVIIAATGAIAFAAYAHGSATLADRTLMSALEEAQEVVEALKPFDRSRLHERLAGFSDSHEGFLIDVLDGRGRSLYQSDPTLSALLPRSMPALSQESRSALATLSVGNRGQLRMAGRYLPHVASGVRLEMGVLLPHPLQLFSTRQAYWVIFAFLALAGALGWAGWLIAGRALLPIARITGVAETVSRGALHERIPAGDRADELGGLVRVLNEMLGNVEASNVSLGQFAANVSHQLKTPLTIMRGEIEVALRGQLPKEELKAVLESALAELESLSAIVADLLAFARLENTRGPATSVRIDRLLEVIARKAAVLSGPKRQTLELALESGPLSAPVRGDRLEQALLNILDNAVRHTPEEGSIVLRLRAAGEGAEITIEDSGPGVSAEELPRLFERGRSRSGTGLGLMIAKAMIESFGATIELSSPGSGLKARITLPRATRPS